MRDIVETANSFVGALESAAETDTIEMVLDEIEDSKRQISSITIEVDTTPGKYLVVIPKSKLEQLVRGRTYGFRVSRYYEIHNYIIILWFLL